MAEKSNNRITVKSLDGEKRLQEGLHMYLFDENEHFIEASNLNKGEAQFNTDVRDIHRRGQIFIGPEIPKEIGERKITPILIRKMGGYQPTLPNKFKDILDVGRIPEIVIPKWNWCYITGNLTKSFTIDGNDKILPVGRARVHICEIDIIPKWQPRIPDWVVSELAQKLKDVIVKPKSPTLPGNRTIEPLFINEKPEVDKEVLVSLSQGIPDTVKRGLLSGSKFTVRETLLENLNWFRPYLCWWPKYWPYFYRCEELTTVETDCNGRFGYFHFNPTEDRDIYFWVEMVIDGEWVTMHRPNIPCNTYWNYSCGREISIRLTDPRVPLTDCKPLEGAYVWMKRVNSGTTIRSIEQNSEPGGHLDNSIGLTWYHRLGSKQRVSPFGSTFPFVVKFGNAFPEVGGVTHYRWSYRQLKDASLNDIPANSENRILENFIAKPFEYDINTPEGTLGARGSYKLGPFFDVSGKPMYKIPSQDAKKDKPSMSNAEYTSIDTQSIQVFSNNLENGLYEFKFELLDDDGNVVLLPANTYLVDKLGSDKVKPGAPDADSIFASNLSDIGRKNYLKYDATGRVAAFKFKMRIDNQACYADILDAEVSGNPTDSACGVGKYNTTSDEITLNFLAGHPQDFATYAFSVTRGKSNNVDDAKESGFVTKTDNGYEYVKNGINGKDLYKKSNGNNNLLVSRMMDSCDMAAFAEVLRVSGTHTNGSVRLSHYDKKDVAAIVLANNNNTENNSQ